MCVFDKEFKKKKRKKAKYTSQSKAYNPNKGLLCGSQDKFVPLKGYRKL